MSKNREMNREPLRETVRDPIRPTGNEVVGRDGTILSRKRGSNVDRFYIPDHLIPAGYTYEWKREFLYGQRDDAHITHLHDNGWRPVVHGAHKGYFSSVSDPTEIIRRDGMMLMERPAELTRQAREEDFQAAQMLVEAQKQQLTGAIPQGFKGTTPSLKTSYAPSDVARPRLTVEE